MTDTQYSLIESLGFFKDGNWPELFMKEKYPEIYQESYNGEIESLVSIITNSREQDEGVMFAQYADFVLQQEGFDGGKDEWLGDEEHPMWAKVLHNVSLRSGDECLYHLVSSLHIAENLDYYWDDISAIYNLIYSYMVESGLFITFTEELTES